MKVGIHFGDFVPQLGGGYTYVAELLLAFADQATTSEHDYVILCTPKAAETLRFAITAPNVTVVPMATQSRIGHWILALKYISPLFRRLWHREGVVEREARRNGVQLLWFVGVNFYESPDVPYVATMFDLQHRLQPYFPEVGASREWNTRDTFYSYFLRRASYCVTGTEVGKRQTQDLYHLAEARIRVVPLPTPNFALTVPTETGDVRSRFGIDREYVFYPAQFWPHKNHANLILALKYLRHTRKLDLSLVFTGSDKGNLSFVKRFAEKQGMADRVRFLGFVSEDELVALYKGALALTYVTYLGPDNIPPLEAFALGCPVIASAVEGATEQYGNAVIQVDPSDPQGIGDAIWRLRSDDQLRVELVESGRTRALSWTAADYIGGMFKLFDEFAAVRRNWA